MNQIHHLSGCALDASCSLNFVMLKWKEVLFAFRLQMSKLVIHVSKCMKCVKYKLNVCFQALSKL